MPVSFFISYRVHWKCNELPGIGRDLHVSVSPPHVIARTRLLDKVRAVPDLLWLGVEQIVPFITAV